MRKLIAVAAVAVAGLIGLPAMAADIPDYPPVYDVPDLPPVDYGLGGSFYLRGSVGANLWTASSAQYCGCFTTITGHGFGYSVGAGFGYETGDGLRADITADYIDNRGLSSATGNTANLRSGLVLANLYYDFGFGENGYSAAGGFGAYLGAGLGAAYNYSEIMSGATQLAWGTSVEAAAAVMAGVTYDMGQMVADVGYRGIYMNKVMSQPPSIANAYLINNNLIHEVRGTLRYRLQ